MVCFSLKGTQEPKAVGAQSILLLRRHQLLGQALPKVPHQRLLVRSKTMVLVPPRRFPRDVSALPLASHPLSV